MYQSGEVDYLVATDAIGMGLNMDVAHVAFAGLRQVRRPPPPPADARRDGADRRPRRAPPEATARFGTVHLAARPARRASRPRRSRRWRRIASSRWSSSYWRNTDLDFGSLPKLLATLDARSPVPQLQRGDDADRPRRAEAAGRRPWVMERAHRPRRPARHGAAVGGLRPARLPQDRRRSSMRGWSAGCSGT